MKARNKEIYRTILFVVVFDLLCLLAFSMLKPTPKYPEFSTMDEMRTSLGGFAVIFDAFVFGLMGLIIYAVQEYISILLSDASKGFKLFIKELQTHSIGLLLILAIIAGFYIITYNSISGLNSVAEKFISLYGFEGWMIVALIVITDAATLLIMALISKHRKA
jgi:hypothetical protein